MQKISRNINKSTVRVITKNDKGTGYGTAFIFMMIDNTRENSAYPLLVTNKHVIEGAKEARVLFNLVDHELNRKVQEVIVSNPESEFIPHPNPETDLCVLQLSQYITDLQAQGFTLDIFPFNDEWMDTSSLTPVEDVYMTGYPNGLWDEVNNKPLTRKGITASDVNLNWNGMPQFTIDMACFPGSSGSPVYIMNEGGYSVEGGMSFGSRLILLGILSSGPLIDIDGTLEVIEIPTTTGVIPRSKFMMNLGYVIKATELLAFRPILESGKK